jgi:hypothetical protein
LQQLACLGQPAGDGAFLAAQGGSRLGPAHALEAAQDERRPIFFGEALHLFIELPLQLAPRRFAGRCGLGLGEGCFLLMLRPPRGHLPRFHRGSVGDAVQPATDCLSLANGCGFARQDEEHRLKSVFGVLLLT